MYFATHGGVPEASARSDCVTRRCLSRRCAPTQVLLFMLDDLTSAATATATTAAAEVETCTPATGLTALHLLGMHSALAILPEACLDAGHHQ